MFKVDNAVIMAAGTSSRFAPISYERPKALIEVRGEVLIERQIRQLQEAGINDIYIVTGYRAADFDYLKEKYGVKIRENTLYNIRNNHSSIYLVRDVLKNSYICSADNYFTVNPFSLEIEESYYSALYSEGETSEWCMTCDEEGYIKNVVVGGRDSWYMLGHVFWSEEFSKHFVEILEREYALPETNNKLWEDIFIDHLDEFKMKIHKYKDGEIYEFDTLDELRKFDKSYITDARSNVLDDIADILRVSQKELNHFKCIKGKGNEAVGVELECKGMVYSYDYKTKKLELKG